MLTVVCSSATSVVVATFRRDESMMTIKLASEATKSVHHTEGCFAAASLIHIAMR
jgi:hypothetical protein